MKTKSEVAEQKMSSRIQEKVNDPGVLVKSNNDEGNYHTIILILVSK